MKKFLSIILIILLLVASVGGSLYVYNATRRNKLQVGFAKENISPVIDGEILHAPLGGYAGLRVAEIIESDIYAICTAFRDNDGDTALLYSIDNLGISTKVAEEITKAIGESVGVPDENIILNCMHNHAAPLVDSDMEESYAYRQFFIKKLITVAKNAIYDLSLCTRLSVGDLNIEDFSYIRREDDTEIDPSVPVARFSRLGKRDILLINWAAHCDTVASSIPSSVSSDYVGVLRDCLAETGKFDVSVQMGACGDVSPSCFFKDKHTYIGKDKYGAALAKEISKQLYKLKTVKITSKIDSITRTVGVKVNHSDDTKKQNAIEIRNLYYTDKVEKYKLKCKEYGIENIYEATSIVQRANADSYENITLRAVSVGNLVFATAPYEMFAHNGKAIKNASEFDNTFVMGYSNGKEGYIPSDYAYSVGGYEVYYCKYECGTAELLADTLSDMVDELYGTDLCRHEFVPIESDEKYHLLKCRLCQYKFKYYAKHSFNEEYVCAECNEHIHKKGILKGFSGITLSCIGSSTTQGAGIEHSYVDVVKELLGLEAAYNYGISWSTIGHQENCDCDHSYLPDSYDHDPMVYRYDDMKNSNIYFVWGGLNDFGMELPLGTISDETPHTFYGALNLLYKGIKTKHPDAYLFTATGLNYFDGYTNEDGVTWAEYNDAIRNSANNNGIDCLDLYLLPFNRLIDTYDYVHPTQKFTDNVLAPAIADFIKNNFPRYYYYDGCSRCDEGEKLYYNDLFADTIENHGKICTYDLETKQFIEKESEYASYTLIDLEGINAIRFSFTKEAPSVDWSYFFYDENNKCVGGGNITAGLIDVYVDVPENAKYIGVIYNPKHQYKVYQAA